MFTCKLAGVYKAALGSRNASFNCTHLMFCLQISLLITGTIKTSIWSLGSGGGRHSFSNTASEPASLWADVSLTFPCPYAGV